jgi:hypothetical protein
MVLSPFFILLPPHYSRFPQKIQAAHGSFFPPPATAFFLVCNIQPRVSAWHARAPFVKRKKHPPQDVQQVPEI